MLRCGQDCFIPCEGGVAVSAEDTESFKGQQSFERDNRQRGSFFFTKAGCQETCEIADGCLGYTYVATPSLGKELCTLKYGPQQAAPSNTCKGEIMMSSFFS